MNKLVRWANLTIKLQISTLMAWLLVAPPILASDGQPGDYLNSTNNSSGNQSQPYQGYTQTQSNNDCGNYAPTANYQQQPQQNWTPQPAGQPSYYGQVQTQQSVPQQNYNSGYQPTTSVNTNVWQGAQPTASESNTRNSGQASSAQNDSSSGTASAMGQVATKVLPVAAAMVGMGIMNKMRTGSMMGYPSYGGYGNPYGYGGGYGGYGGGYGYGGYGGYGGGYGMNPMNMMMNPMSRMGMGGMGMGGMGMNPLNMIRF